MEFLFSAFLISFGLVCAWFYLRRPFAPIGSTSPRGRDERPWRRVGAAICLLCSVMFVLGVYVVDVPDHPRAYAAYWIVIMVLVLWLCGLAVKDVFYTRQIIARWRAQQTRLTRASTPPSARAGDSRP